MALAASGLASAAVADAARIRPINKQRAYAEDFAVSGGQPHDGTAGMGRGTKVRGNRATQRAAAKRRNQLRHRKACRG